MRCCSSHVLPQRQHRQQVVSNTFAYYDGHREAMRISHFQLRRHSLAGCPVLVRASNAHQYAQNTCQTHYHTCTSSNSATVSSEGVLPVMPTCRLLSSAMHAMPRLERNFPLLSNASALTVCGLSVGGLLAIAIRDIFAFYCGKDDVKVRVDRVKAHVQVCFEGLMVCIARPCHAVQALLQPCALISINILGLNFRWRAFQIAASVLVYQFLVWCMLLEASLRLPIWLPRDLHQEPSRTKSKL